MDPGVDAGDARLELHLRPGIEGARVLDVLAQACDLPQAELERALERGAVWITRGRTPRRARRRKATLRALETVSLWYDPRVLAEEPLPATLVADEGDYSVWSKPCGMRSGGSKWGDHTSVGRWAELHLEPQREAWVVHRLDRHTRGLILIAHGKRAAAAFSALLRERGVTKVYQAWVRGAFPATPQRYTDPLDGKPCETTARRLRHDPAGDRSLLEVDLGTGRKHQIRRHLAAAGFPVLGDRLYGDDASQDLQLAAVRLAFTCPLSGAPRVYALEQALA